MEGISFGLIPFVFVSTALAGDRGLSSFGSCNSSDRLPLSPFPGQSSVGEQFAPTLPAGTIVIFCFFLIHYLLFT